MFRRTFLLSALIVLAMSAGAMAEPLKALIVDGQNNHNWKGTTPEIRQILEQSGLFTVDVATSPSGRDLSGFKPNFDAYDVVVSNYNGAPWPEETQKALEEYMAGGGGLVVIHAADNAFPQWDAYNEMIGLGGWGGRNEKSGPYVYYQDDQLVRDDSPGRGGGHGSQYPIQIVVRAKDHPAVAKLPERFMHSKEELYIKLRGPAKNMTVLATARSRDTKRHEPVLMAIDYGKGRVFHTVLGHAPEQFASVALIVTLQHGTEWAATGKVTQELPDDMPTADEASRRD